MSETPRPAVRLSAREVSALLEQKFPHMHATGGRLVIEEVAAKMAVVRLEPDERSLRPGGTISGPALFTLSDFAAYVAILGELGPGALDAVTSSMAMNFLSKPASTSVTARTRLIKVGRRLITAVIELYSQGQPAMVAHATATYAIPPALDEKRASV